MAEIVNIPVRLRNGKQIGTATIKESNESRDRAILSALLDSEFSSMLLGAVRDGFVEGITIHPIINPAVSTNEEDPLKEQMIRGEI